MKKIIAILMTLAMLCISSVAFAAMDVPANVPAGYEVTMIRDFSAFNGDMLASAAQFWMNNPATDDREVTFENGRVTFYQQGTWGAFFSFTQEEMNMLDGKSGWGFYVKNGEMDTVICAGFNSASGKNFFLGEDVPYMLVDMEGNAVIETTIWSSSNQGGIIIPYEFEGYLYIPFTSYVNSGDGSEYDATDYIFTPIYALSEGEEFTYGEFFSYSSDSEMVPGEEPVGTEAPVETEPADDATEVPSAPADNANGGFPIWIVIVAAVVVVAVVVVVVIIASKKKKAE